MAPQAHVISVGLVRRCGCVLAGVLLVLMFAVPGGALAAGGASGRGGISATAPGDQAATHALLRAELRLVKAVLAHVSSMEAALASAAKSLGDQCNGVLRGVPDESAPEEEGPLAPKPKPSGRVQGERARSELEKQTIDTEISETLLAAEGRVLRGAYAAYIATAMRLSWSDATITALVHQQAARLREDLQGSPVVVCPEMRRWASTRFHVLPHGSRAFKQAEEARDKQIVVGDLEVLLRPYETRASRSLARRITTLKEQVRERERNSETGSEAVYRMRLALGEKVSRYVKQEHAPVIAKGRTGVGSTFVVRRSVGKRSGGCRHEVEVEIHERRSGSSSGLCISEGIHSHPSSMCSESTGIVELATSPDIHQVRVHLSDDRTLIVPILYIPAKDGGPAGVFIRAYDVHAPYPVSLQELNANGRVLRTVNLKSVRCRTEPAADEPGPPEFINLATVTAPSGETITLQGILHRFHAKTEFFLQPPPGIRESQAGKEHEPPKQFQWNLSTECAPHPYTLLDGILTAPGASVLARTSTGLTPLTRVELPASAHAEGPLFYGIYTSPPTEIIVQQANGTVLYTENLAAKATEETEFCEGYAER